MTYAMPIYTLRIALEDAQVVSCFGLEGLLDTVPLLAPELYSVDVLGARSQGSGIRGQQTNPRDPLPSLTLDSWERSDPDPYSDVATAAVHESGAWTLNFSDGREYADNTRLIRLGKIR